MGADGAAAEQDVVRRLARGSLLSRLRRSKQPLKLAAVPRDHVAGDRQRGDALIAGRFVATLKAKQPLTGETPPDPGAAGGGARRPAISQVSIRHSFGGRVSRGRCVLHGNASTERAEGQRRCPSGGRATHGRGPPPYRSFPFRGP